MKELTARLWTEQNRHPGDRTRLFQAVADFTGAVDVLYPGCFVDVAASMVFEAVTYVDVDRRASEFFADLEGVLEIVRSESGSRPDPRVRFVSADFTEPLDLQPESFDLLVSLYAGFVSAHCTGYLRVGGMLLAHPSHGDAAMASIDPRYRFSGVVLARSGSYRVMAESLETYLIPRSPVDLSIEGIRLRGRGVAYTRKAFAYLFTRVQ